MNRRQPATADGSEQDCPPAPPRPPARRDVRLEPKIEKQEAEHIRAGRLRPLAVTTPARLDVLPDVPTVDEFVPGYEAILWQGIGAPKGTPSEIVDSLNQEINAALVNHKMKARLADLGNMTLPGSPADFEKLIVKETEKWGRVIRAANIKVD